jgi:hypothetical protein
LFVVAGDDFGGTKGEVEKGLRVIEIADGMVVRNGIDGDGFDAAAVGGTAFEDGGCPFGEAPEGFGDCSRR